MVKIPAGVPVPFNSPEAWNEHVARKRAAELGRAWPWLAEAAIAKGDRSVRAFIGYATEALLAGPVAS